MSLDDLTAEMRRVVDESARRLLKDSVPPVRTWLLEYIMDKGREDLALQRAFAEAERFPPRVKLIKTLREDGTWPIPTSRRVVEDAGPGPPYGWTYMTMLRNLYMLFEYRAPREEGHIDAAVERILGWQHEDGYIMGPDPDTIPRPHYNGLALAVACRYGRERDPRTKAIVRWLLRSQRRDGGWVIPYLQDVKYLPQYKHMRVGEFVRLVRRGDVPEYDASMYYDIPSCAWSTVGAMRGIAWDPTQIGSRDSRRGCMFILDSFFRRNHHANFNKSERNWTILKFPTYHGSGLTAMDTLMYMGIRLDEKRMERAVRWLMGARSTDGYWYRSERPHPLDDQLVTVTALMILKYLSDRA